MVHLTDSEEKVMLILWKKEKALMHEILSEYDDPKPAKTTLATLLKRLTNKNAISFTMVENKRLYHPLVKKEQFSSNRLQGFIKNFFNNSASQLASYCTTETDLNKEELKQLRDIIDKQIDSK